MTKSDVTIGNEKMLSSFYGTQARSDFQPKYVPYKLVVADKAKSAVPMDFFSK